MGGTLEDQLDRDPHDDAAFLVYADALLERGDPHGELIRVQYALQRSPGDRALALRETELMQAMMPELGELTTAHWKLGFPRVLDLMWVGDQNFGRLQALLRTRLCRFIEAVSLSDYVQGGKREQVVELLSLLPHLKEVTLANNLEVLSNRSALALLATLAQLRELEVLRLRARSATALLSELPGFPKLRRLVLADTHLQPEDATPLELARQRVGAGCRLVLERATCSFQVEAAVTKAWPFELDVTHGPGLLIEAPAAERGAWLLSAGKEQRIGNHAACDLALSGSGLRAVHSVFDGSSIRDAGALDSPSRWLAPGDVLMLGEVRLRYCTDVLAERARLRTRSG